MERFCSARLDKDFQCASLQEVSEERLGLVGDRILLRFVLAVLGVLHVGVPADLGAAVSGFKLGEGERHSRISLDFAGPNGTRYTGKARPDFGRGELPTKLYIFIF